MHFLQTCEADKWGKVAGVTSADKIKVSFWCQMVFLVLLFFFFEEGRMIAKKDQAADVYFYVSAVKTELPNSSEGQNFPGN